MKFSLHVAITFSILLSGLISLSAHGAAVGNPVKGAEIFKQCAVCHAVGEGAVNTVGPNLNHVFGRPAGSVEDYNYSEAMRTKGDSESLVWDEQSIYIFLAGPARYIPGTTMGFEGLRTEKEIRDLMSWLVTYSPAYEPGSGKIVPANVASAATLPAAQSEEEEEEVPDFTEKYLSSADALSTGQELWAGQCRHCHGNSAYPGKAPKLKPSRYSADFVFKRVTNGFKKMPAWKSVFSLEERKAITAYVMSSKFSP